MADRKDDPEAAPVAQASVQTGVTTLAAQVVVESKTTRSTSTITPVSSERAPEEKAGPISKIFFGYATGLFVEAWRRRRDGAKQDKKKILEQAIDAEMEQDEFAKLQRKLQGELEEDDFWALPKDDHVEPVAEIFAKRYNEYVKKPKDSDTKRLTLALIASCKRPMIIAGVLKFFNTGLQFSYPFLLKNLLLSLQPFSNRPVEEAYYWAIGLGGAMLIKALTENSYFWYGARGAWRARQAISSAIYRKSLRLSLASRQSKTLGEMVNLMQIDAAKIELFLASAHSLWDGIMQIIGYTLILFWVIGWSAFVGLAFMLTMIPIQGYVMKTMLGIDRRVVKVTDERVKKVNEAIQGILGVKMAAWEDSFAKVLGTIRDNEVSMLRSTVWLKSFSSAYMMSTPALTAAVAIAVYATAGNGYIDAATLFTALNTFGQLRFPLMLYPMSLAQYLQATVSRRRLAAFLDMDEVKFTSSDIDSSSSDTVVDFEDVTVFWADPARPLPIAAAPTQQKAKGKKGAALAPESTQKLTGSTSFVNPAAPSTMVPAGASSSALTAAPATASSSVAGVLDGPQQKSMVPALEHITMTIKKGELVAVVGGVGQGKTALVNSILREMFLSSGKVSLVPGPVAFASQMPWILNATVKDNIVFGAEFDPVWYERVLDACQLRHDLSMLDEYDMTEIGERGVSLSGGQKQRISTARAAYHARASTLVILDDPISALDPEVGARLFEECILDLLSETTRLVVTNNLDILKECDRIIVITGGEGLPGRIAEQGTFEALMGGETQFAALMSRHRGGKEDDRTPSPAGGDVELSTSDQAQIEKRKLRKNRSSGTANPVSSNALLDPRRREAEAKVVADASDPKKMGRKHHTSIIKSEERAKGSVSRSMYATYIKSGGGYVPFLFVYVLFIISQGLAWLNTYWMTIWSNDVRFDGSYKTQTLAFFIVGYALTAILMALSAFVRTGALMMMALKSSTNLHRRLLQSVLHARMHWFDQTPTGRILQRFSQDIRTLDTETSENASFFLFTTLFVLVSLGTIIGVTPIFAAFLIPFLAVYFLMLNFYRPVMRDAKRIGSIVTSPVYAHFSETLGGVLSVRAFKVSGTFAQANSKALDRFTRMSMSLKLCERWLGVRLELIGTSICFVSAMFCVQAVSAGLITAGAAGLSLSFSMSTTFLLTSTIRSFAALEASMNSVERVDYMGTHVPQEKWRDEDYENGELIIPDESWPTQGAIKVEDLKMRYREDTPFVLKGISFSIAPGEKIGVAGRTGSGKSSLFLTLLRIVEPHPGSRVIIDGIDVSKVPLLALRSRVSIAPQLPVLFSGTLRYNLDPFERHSDSEIWDAIERVGMKVTVQALTAGLLAPVSEYGENFSQGERQLVSLARAVLAKPKILLLDESTASLDADRDQLIQATIHDSFKNATMIVIAHRLETIVRSDRILVLGNGEILEFDKPAVLLENPESQLSLAVQEMGEGQAERMKKQASSARD